ncbi:MULTISPECIES: hypothetical protein [Burkholderia]|uniref:hypothetical protein n=1 Tax=Burkholderia sp. AU28863 TaxID=2015352 RepID=UPI000B7A0230|nr:hypothetical protein [Burkholderia sp. AU28863]OXI67412.1 hypothetical protein CFB81_22385 [Burkholderia sp. AU28863]
MSLLTGNTRYRLGWFGKVILEVSEWRRQAALSHPDTWPWIEVWRDATFRDVLDLAERNWALVPRPSKDAGRAVR